MTKDIYYVYAYIRSKDSKIAPAGTLYYIGKGKGRRAFVKHSVGVPKDKTKIIFLQENLSEEKAFELEQKIIAEYGRIDLGNGILRNQTDGGNGGFNVIYSSERKDAASKSSWMKTEKGRKWILENTPFKNKETIVKAHKTRKERGTNIFSTNNPMKCREKALKIASSRKGTNHFLVKNRRYFYSNNIDWIEIKIETNLGEALKKLNFPYSTFNLMLKYPTHKVKCGPLFGLSVKMERL